MVIRGRPRAASRGRSAIITQKEVSLLLRRDDDKSPPTAASGFVRSMTQFYTELCHVTSDKNNNKLEVLNYYIIALLCYLEKSLKGLSYEIDFKNVE